MYTFNVVPLVSIKKKNVTIMTMFNIKEYNDK